MSVVGPAQFPIEVVSGLVTNIDPTALPPGVSPDCADVVFKPGTPGTVQTRPGTSLVHQFAGNPTLNYQDTFTDLQGNDRNLYLDSLGNLWQEFPQGTFAKVNTAPNTTFLSPGMRAKSDTGFGREFIGFNDNQFGINIPRQWDGANFDRVSSCGPGESPQVTDLVSSGNIVASPSGLIPLSGLLANAHYISDYIVEIHVAAPGDIRDYMAVGDMVILSGTGNPAYDGTWTISALINAAAFRYVSTIRTAFFAGGVSVDTGIVTLNTTAPQTLITGQMVPIAGATDPTYDGTWQIRVGGTGTSFTLYIPAVIGVAASGGGTIASSGPGIGLIPAGIHKLSVCFKMRSGYITRPSPPFSWTAGGDNMANVAGIPIGPSSIVVARILIATVAGGNDFFWSEKDGKAADGSVNITAMLIPDNTTTSWTINFTDLALQNSVPANDYFDLLLLPEVAGFIQYGDRMIAWGARNALPNWENLVFDGGFDPDGVRPLGWIVDSTSGAGGGRAASSPVWGDYYTVTGDGATSTRGKITQVATADYLGVDRISPNVSYSVRALLRKNPTNVPTVGVCHVHLQSASLAIDTGLDVPVGSLTTTFQEFTGVLTVGISIIPDDLLLAVYVDGTPSNGKQFDFENIELFPTAEPYQTSVLFGSNVADPESFQSTTGFANINENDGNRIVNCYIIRDRLYITKNRGGLFVTTSDPSADFSDWTIDTISLRIGCESINGVGAHETDTGEDWVFTFAREGLYASWSSEPVKCSQEIQPTWEQINWDAADTAWLVTDTANRRVLIGVPIGNATSPNKILQMDYKLCGATAESVADSPPVSSTYSGEIRAHGVSRKWSIWNLQMNIGGFIERNDGTPHLFLGNGAGNGNLYDLLDANLSDEDGPINGYWITAGYPSDEQKQSVLQMKGNRVQSRYLTAFVQGIGNLQITSYGPGFVNSYVTPILGAPKLVLETTASQDMETMINFTAERHFLKFQAQHETTPWFSLANAQLYMAEDPVAAIRGFN